MTLMEFFGCSFIAFGPPLALLIFTIAKDPLRIIVLMASCFFWLIALLLSSLLWYAVVPLRDKLAFGLVFSVLFQELFRFLFYILLRKADEGLTKVSQQSGQTQLVNNKHLMAYVSGLGFGVINGAFSLVNVLADSSGPGTIGLKGDSDMFFVVSGQKEPLPTEKPFPWKQAFLETPKWKGTYVFKKVHYNFEIEINSVQDEADGLVMAKFTDDIAEFELKGFQHPDGEIVFQAAGCKHPSEKFPLDSTWFIKGKLLKRSSVWTYEGHLESTSVQGFRDLMMQPNKTKATLRPRVRDEGSNLMAIMIGVCVSLVCIVLALAITYLCAKRKGGIRATGHRSLTSFENPVYEYENNAKPDTEA